METRDLKNDSLLTLIVNVCMYISHTLKVYASLELLRNAASMTEPSMTDPSILYAENVNAGVTTKRKKDHTTL